MTNEEHAEPTPPVEEVGVYDEHAGDLDYLPADFSAEMVHFEEKGASNE
jgi:hypothetical protein